MNVNRVSCSLIGGLMLVGACAGCTNNSYEKKAKSQAVEYLSAEELIKAENYAEKQFYDGQISSKAINYWDSLLLEAKSKEAYIKGKQAIIDSVKGDKKRNTIYKTNIDTVIDYSTNHNLCDKLRTEYAKYSSAKDFIKARENSPFDYISPFGAGELPYKTHYWNLITISNRQKDAYNKGMADARKELSKNK